MEVSKLIIPSNGEQVTVNIKDATAREAIANLDGISPSDVEDKDATLSWGTKTEIATIGELSIHVTLPSNPDTNAVTSVSGKTGVVTLDKSDVGLGNVDNTADANKSVLYAATAGAAPASDVYSWAKAENKPTYTKSEVGLGNVTNDAQIKRTEMGVAEGVATLNSSGKVPASQLPSFVDDIIEGYLDGVHFYSDSAHTTIVTDETGASSDQLAGKIYVDLSTNKTYRWGGSAYTIISSDIAIGNTTGTAADGGVVNTHVNDTSNPHSVTKEQVGLGNVTNDAQVKRTEMGVANGVATLNASGKIPDALLPNYKDVIEGYYSNGAFYTAPAITHDYVEIDGVKWATMNIGASSVTDYGLYFQWGDSQGYTSSLIGSGEDLKYFSWADYKYGNGEMIPGNQEMSKYNAVDQKTTLDPSDDGATVAWGGAWRMPTYAEIEALGEAVNTTWTSDYNDSGVAGRIMTDKTDNSKSLFFPAAGYYYQGSGYAIGQEGRYLTNTNSGGTTSSRASYSIKFSNSYIYYNYLVGRSDGLTIRAVYDGDAPTAITAVTGALYVDKTTNTLYRYDGSAFIQLGASAISTQSILALFDGGIDDEDTVIGVPTADEDIEAMWDGYDPFDTEEEEEQQSNE